MAQPNITIWGTKGSTCTDRALFAAYELGVPVTFNPIDFGKGGHKSPEHMARQPFGKVPAAEVNGFSFYESRAITRVVARSAQGGEALFPSHDLKQVALFEQWASLEAGTITPITEKIVAERVFKPMFGGGQPDAELTKKTLADGQTAFQVLDKQLSSNEYVIGQFSLIDIFLSTYFFHFAGTPEGKETLSKYPNIAAWWQRLSARPTFKQIKAETTIGA